jgi:hypothetical protein
VNDARPDRRGVHSPHETEFGLALAALVREVPGALGAVLSDDVGDAIDFAHDPAVISDLDVQLVGAQIGQSVLELGRSFLTRGAPARHRRIDEPLVLLEARDQAFVAAPVADRFVLAMLLDHRANFARALRSADHCRARLRVLLGV